MLFVLEQHAYEHGVSHCSLIITSKWYEVGLGTPSGFIGKGCSLKKVGRPTIYWRAFRATSVDFEFRYCCVDLPTVSCIVNRLACCKSCSIL